MQIEISEATYQAIAANRADVAAFVEQTLQQALAKQRTAAPTENLIERFQSFRGTLRDTTIEDIVADRHRGLK